MNNFRKSIRKELFEKYEVEYDTHTKVIHINKPVPVSDFLILRYYFKEMDYKNIIIE